MGRLLRAGTTMLLMICGLSVLAASPTVADSAVTDHTDLPFTSFGDHVVDSRNGQIFVAGDGESDPPVITDLSGNLLRTVPELAGVRRLALSPRGASLFASRAEEIVRLDPVTLAERDRYQLPGIRHVDDIAVAGRQVWVAGGFGFRHTYRIDIRTGEVRRIANDGGTFYRATLETLPSRGVVAVLGEEHEPRVSTLDARTGKLLATRAFPYDARIGLEATPEGDLVLFRELDTSRSVLRLDPETLERVRRGTPPVGKEGTASTDGRLLALGVHENDDHDSVRVARLFGNRVRNHYRLAFGHPLLEVFVVDTFFTPAGLLVVSQDYIERQPVRLHHIADPRARSSTLRFHMPDDAEVGLPTTVSGTLTYRGEPVAGGAIRFTDTNVYGDPEEPRYRTARTDARGRFSFSYTPRFGEERYEVKYPGSRRAPGSWLRVIEHIQRPPSEVTLSAPTSVTRGEPLTVTGQVTSRDAPAGGSTVSTRVSCPYGDDILRRTDEEGRFSLTYPTTNTCSSITVEVTSQGSPSIGFSPVATVTVAVDDTAPTGQRARATRPSSHTGPSDS